MQNNNNPAVIGVVRSISGTNVSVQLYKSLNSTISYINGNGYKIGQVGGFVKIPQGYVNLYGRLFSSTNARRSVWRGQQRLTVMTA